MIKLRALAPLGAFTRRRVVSAAATALLVIMPTCPPKQATDPDPVAMRTKAPVTVAMVVSGQH